MQEAYTCIVRCEAIMCRMRSGDETRLMLASLHMHVHSALLSHAHEPCVSLEIGYLALASKSFFFRAARDIKSCVSQGQTVLQVARSGWGSNYKVDRTP